ncbi:MAG: NAD(P)H-dependent oxidoreductase [Verrucomicrobiales bacterium]|nr:NAD(P)H-dependent oxidoreductase [Verrucomicrobiales bacterium]
MSSDATNQPELKVLLVVGSLRRNSVSRVVLNRLAELLAERGCVTDVLDLAEEELPLYNPDEAYARPGFAALRQRVDTADGVALGSPDYHGSISSPLKNFLDHFWHEFAGKLMVPLIASHEKGLTAMDQLRTVARQCYAWALPYGVSYVEKVDVQQGRIVNDKLVGRLQMLARDVAVYGRLLATQRRTDLAGNEPGYLAQYRR